MVAPLPIENVRPLHVRLFGTPVVTYDGKPVRFVAAKTVPLFAYLILGRKRPFARDQLAYKFWPDRSEAEARGNLRRHLHRINGALFEVSGQRWLETNDNFVAFHRHMPFVIDVERLEAAAANPAEAANAVPLYAGDLFDGCDEDWLIPHRERLRLVYLRLLVGLVDRYRGERHFSEAIALSQRILHLDPLREDAVRTLMSLHYESGDRSSALSEFQTFRQLLQVEIGAEPMRETQSLHDAIRRHAAIGGRKLDRPSLERGLPFEGRDDEIDALRDGWQQAASGKARLVMISGEAGIGKTRLLREFALLAEREGARVLWGGSSTPEATPYEPVIEALAGAMSEIGRLSLSPALLSALAVRFPELRLAQPDLLENVDLIEQRNRERFFDAIAFAVERLCTTRPTVIVLEDLHSVLDDTLQLITRIARTCARAPLFAVLSYREEEMSAALRSFRLDFSKEASRIGLGRLEPAACRKIVERGYDTVAAEVSEWAIDLAKGNPLFLSELIRQYDKSARDELPADATMPISLESAISSRLTTLSEGARSLLDIAAIGGAVVSIDVLQYASGWPLAEILDRMDELVDRFVIRETATGSRGEYQFAHELIREAVLRSMPRDLAIRRHRRFAKALLYNFPTRLDEFARVLAQHFESAGQLEEASRFYARAATFSREQYAWQDALRFTERALLLEKRARERFFLHAAIESAASISADHGRQTAAIASMFDLADELGDPALRAIALGRSSEFALQTGDFDRQRRATDELQSIATRSGDTSLLGSTLRCRARAEINSGRPSSAVSTMQAIETMDLERPLADQIEDLRTLAHAQALTANFEAAKAAMIDAECRAGSSPTLANQLAIARTRAMIALEMADRTEAVRLSPILLSLCRRVGDVEGEGNAHQVAARIDWWAFNVASARKNLRAATAIFERIGRPHSRASIAINAGALENHVGLLDDAERFYSEALAHTERLEAASFRSMIFGNFAYVALLRGDADRALADSERALHIARESNDLRLVAIHLGLVGTALRQLRRPADRSLACFSEALDLCEHNAFVDERLELFAEVLPTLTATGKHEQAAAFATELEHAIAADASAVVMPVSALMKVADVYEANADDKAARALRERARTLLRKRLEKLPDEKTRAAYASLRDHRALLEEATTSASSPRRGS